MDEVGQYEILRPATASQIADSTRSFINLIGCPYFRDNLVLRPSVLNYLPQQFSGDVLRFARFNRDSDASHDQERCQ
jgi:hypothetical protein